MEGRRARDRGHVVSAPRSAGPRGVRDGRSAPALDRALARQGPGAVFRDVALPLSWRGVLAGTLLAFSRALGEFGATILVAGNIPGRTQTLALAIFHRTQVGEDAAAFRLVGVVAAIAFATVWVTELLQRRRGQRERDLP